MLNPGLIFNLDSAKVCSPAIFKIHFSYHKDVWIPTTDYYMYLSLIVSPKRSGDTMDSSSLSSAPSSASAEISC